MVIGKLILGFLLLISLIGFAGFVIAAAVDTVFTAIEDYRRIKKDEK